MKQRLGALLCVVWVLAGSACGSPDPADSASEEATTSPSVSASRIRIESVPKAALSLEDMGSGWSKFDLGAVEGCTKIGGEICVENLPGRTSSKIQVAYTRDQSGGYVANAVVLMVVEGDAREVMDEFRTAARTKVWNQSFESGTASYKLSALPFSKQGDETFAVHIQSTARNRKSGTESSREIDYIVFRSGRVLSFLYVIKADPAAIARRSAAKIRALIAGDL